MTSSTSKLQNRDEFVRWYNEGRQYSWIVQQYAEKYGIRIGTGTVSNWRAQLGLETRDARDPELIPWAVEPRHRKAYPVAMLRIEARRRAGKAVQPREASTLDWWKQTLAAHNAVVHYDPDTEEGFFLVPRREGIDNDLIREPERRTRVRGRRG